MHTFKILPAEQTQLPLLATLACRLWPHHTVEKMLAELGGIFAKEDTAFFLAYLEETAIGFAQCQLRYDYVEGTEHSPVGYLEGIYVEPAHRHNAVATELLRACESWAKAQGCAEFASDCQLDNSESLQFHLNMGFEEANRIICFTKKL